jgi:DNA polymerase I
MKDTRPVLYLIDGHAVAYRQFFALPLAGFSTATGEPTNATYGFTRILLDILEKDQPAYLAVSFDRGLSGREEVYPDYKGTREKMPDELRVQMERIEEVVRAFSIPILALEGYEADDIIGTVVRQAAALNIHVHIITGDRDILQLLSPDVTVQLPSRSGPDAVFDIAAFSDKYWGLAPAQLVDLKALMGDSSDNIPGVKGIGEKGATNLLTAYGSLDEIYANLDSITGAIHQKLAEGRTSAYMSHELARIRTDVPLSLTLEACVSRDFDCAAVDDLFGTLEFRGFRDRLAALCGGEAEGTTAEAADALVNTVIVQDRAALSAMVTVLADAEAIVFDVETTSTDQMRAVLVGIALSVDGQTGYYVPVGHEHVGDGQQLRMFSEPLGDQLPLTEVIDALRGPLTDPGIPKIAHNASYDAVVMARYGIDVTPIAFDTMIAEWVCNPISRFLGLKNLVRQRLGIHMTEISTLLGNSREARTMDRVAIEDAAPYAAADAAMTHRLVQPLREELEAKALDQLYETLELPLVPVIANMERAGVLIDSAFLHGMGQRLAAIIAELEGRIYDLAGAQFNINSPRQMNEILFDRLGLPVADLKKTSHGYSTDVVTLDVLRNTHAIVPEIIQYREMTKLKGTYVDALPELVNPQTGRIHTSYNQTGTATGRFSSSNPNLQNIPIRTELGREIRRAFVAPPGAVLLAVDYSQIELRVMAHMSGDETLIQAFRDEQDIHRATAAAVYGIGLDDVTYEQRSFAKRVNFGLMYGMGPFRLARDSDLTLAEAETFIETYFQRMPGVRQYIEDTKKRAQEQGYLLTLLGRRRDFPVLKAGATGQRAQGELRAAINMPIQGSAADILKLAMLHLDRELGRARSGARMILQVHDELVLEVPEGETRAIVELVVETMEAAYPLIIPLKANAAVGRDWFAMEEL